MEVNDKNKYVDELNSKAITTKRVKKLSEKQVRINHINSEKRRRQNVRSVYDNLVKTVPGLTQDESRSELIIYLKTINYLKWLYERNASLRLQLLLKHQAENKDTELQLDQNLIWELDPN